MEQWLYRAVQEINHKIEEYSYIKYVLINMTINNQTTEKNPNAVAIGRLGGLKGGPARAKKLTHEQLSEIAQKAAQTRWGRNKKGE